MIHVMMGYLAEFVTSRACIVGDICCSIPSTHVQNIYVINTPLSPDFWEKTLDHLDGLQYMKLSYHDMPDLCYLLTDPEESLREDTSDNKLTLDHTFIPGLEKLDLYHIMFICQMSPFLNSHYLKHCQPTGYSISPWPNAMLEMGKKMKKTGQMFVSVVGVSVD